jgi:ketosteroid isomerase-like protein
MTPTLSPRAVLLIVLSLTTGAACAPPAAEDPEIARSDLRQADAAFTQALADRNLEAWLAFYAPDAVMYPPNQTAVVGPDQIRLAGEEAFAIPGFAFMLSTSQVVVGSGGDVGYTHGIARISYAGPGGTVASRGPNLHVWRKQPDGAWKIVTDIWNSDQPIAPAPAAGS